MERPTRDFALQLIAAKDKMESELLELLHCLRLNNTDMSQPLVDDEGYPLPHINIYEIRATRHKIICLRNDLKKITTQIEAVLHNLHAQQKEGLGLDNHGHLYDHIEFECVTPFARIVTVLEGSPAAKAGLLEGDLIIGFGSLRANNFNDLHSITLIVEHRVDHEIPISVLRLGKLVSVSLVPKKWCGRGLLGCVLLPLDTVDR